MDMGKRTGVDFVCYFPLVRVAAAYYLNKMRTILLPSKGQERTAHKRIY
jgi:hypothetical protein